jgi:hypothetical protein
VPFEKRMDKYRRYQFLKQHLEVGRRCSRQRQHVAAAPGTTTYFEGHSEKPAPLILKCGLGGPSLGCEVAVIPSCLNPVCFCSLLHHPAGVWESVICPNTPVCALHALGSLPQIHWFSIINSCVTVLLLTGFLATILMRVLKNDFVKYSRDDEVGMCRGQVCALGGFCWVAGISWSHRLLFCTACLVRC